MAHSEDYIRNKMYELEKKKVEIEVAKLKTLMDIRDAMLIRNAMYGLEIEKKAKAGEYDSDDVKRVGDDIANIKERIEKRWSE